MKHLTLLILLLFGAALTVGSPLFAQADEDQGDDEEEYVTMEEFQQALDELRGLKSQTEANRPGTTNFIVTGYMSAGYNDPAMGDSTFATTFNPIFLWQIGDRLLVESEVEFEFEGSDVLVNLEYAQMSYLLTDNITVGAGRFINPFGIFRERLHPAWINKLPNFPLPYSDQFLMVPESITGAEVRGAVPVGDSKVTYAVFAGNGPNLDVGSRGDFANVGTLTFDNFEDTNSNKHVGGRVGFLPIPGVEVGGSVLSGQVSGVNPIKTNASDIGTTQWGVDFSVDRDVKPLAGHVKVNAEYIRSQVNTTTFDPTGRQGFGPLRFNNDRTGGYAQLAYRPTEAGAAIIKNTEAVIRYDWLNFPLRAPTNMDLSRVTFGLDYWVGPATVLKVAVDRLFIDRAQNGMSFYFQISTGF